MTFDRSGFLLFEWFRLRRNLLERFLSCKLVCIEIPTLCIFCSFALRTFRIEETLKCSQKLHLQYISSRMGEFIFNSIYGNYWVCTWKNTVLFHKPSMYRYNYTRGGILSPLKTYCILEKNQLECLGQIHLRRRHSNLSQICHSQNDCIFTVNYDPMMPKW